MKAIPISSADRRRGFTLIEMMIVVVVVAVLAAIALPAYQDQVRKSRRASAESVLMDNAAKQQVYLLDSRLSYAGGASCPDVTALTTLRVTMPNDVSTYYDFCVIQGAGPPPTFTARATPKGSQAADLGGVNLEIDNAGLKTPSTAW